MVYSIRTNEGIRGGHLFLGAETYDTHIEKLKTSDEFEVLDRHLTRGQRALNTQFETRNQK